MKRGVAIAVGASALAHGLLLIALDRVDPPRRPLPVAPRLALVDPPSPAIAIDVVALPPPPPDPGVAPLAAAALPPPGRDHATHPGRATIGVGGAPAASDPAGTAGLPGPDQAGRPGQPGQLSMRGVGGPTLTISTERLAALVDDPDAPPPFQPPPPSGALQPSGGGTYRTVRPGFTAHVERDGRAWFDDDPSFDFHLQNPLPSPKDLARSVEQWFADPEAGIRAQDQSPEIERRHDAVVTDGNDDLPRMSDPVTGTIAGGRMELTDWVMRRNGQDPYAAAKRAWLDETRAERVQIATVHNARQLARAEELVLAHLDRLWARTDLDLVAKRAALFELWDDVAEDGEPGRVAAGARARRQVLAFIRAHLPAGSADAYADDELAALNRRRTSRARFAPYR